MWCLVALAAKPHASQVKGPRALELLQLPMHRRNGLDSVQPPPPVQLQAKHGVQIGTTAPSWRHYAVVRRKSNVKKFTSSVKMTTP